MGFKRLLPVCLVVVLSGCDLSGVPHDPKAVFDNPEVYRFSEQVVDALVDEDTKQFVALAHPDINSVDDIDAQMANFYSYFPRDDNFEVSHFYSELRFAPNSELPATPIYLTVYELVGGDGFAQMNIAVSEFGGSCCVVNHWSIVPANSRPSTMHDFSWREATQLQATMLSLALFVVLFIVVTWIVCAFNPRIRFKPIWLGLILFGFWGIDFNWTTQAIRPSFFQAGPMGVNFQIVEFKLLGASLLQRGPFQPWVLSIGSPIGALLYWFLPARKGSREKETG